MLLSHLVYFVEIKYPVVRFLVNAKMLKTKKNIVMNMKPIRK